jgi:hypothetical protein
MLNIFNIKKQTYINSICVKGKITMTALLIMALSVNGGLFAGTIAYSALSSHDAE